MRREKTECTGEDMWLYLINGKTVTKQPFAILKIEKELKNLYHIPDFFSTYKSGRDHSVNQLYF